MEYSAIGDLHRSEYLIILPIVKLKKPRMVQGFIVGCNGIAVWEYYPCKAATPPTISVSSVVIAA